HITCNNVQAGVELRDLDLNAGVGRQRARGEVGAVDEEAGWGEGDRSRGGDIARSTYPNLGGAAGNPRLGPESREESVESGWNRKRDGRLSKHGGIRGQEQLGGVAAADGHVQRRSRRIVNRSSRQYLQVVSQAERVQAQLAVRCRSARQRHRV